jgi:hypothetical protein
MPRFRVHLMLLLALIMGLQGVAVASASLLLPSSAAPAAAVPAAVPPCHGTASADVTTASAADAIDRHGCCDIDCPNMSSCVLGAYAPTALPPLGLHLPAALRPLPHADGLPQPPQPGQLRPPISLHG